MEDTKEADPSLINTDDVTQMTNCHGDAGHGGKIQAVAQTQCNIQFMTKDWDVEIWNHVLVHVLDKDAMDANVTNMTN